MTVLGRYQSATAETLRGSVDTPCEREDPGTAPASGRTCVSQISLPFLAQAAHHNIHLIDIAKESGSGALRIFAP